MILKCFYKSYFFVPNEVVRKNSDKNSVLKSAPRKYNSLNYGQILKPYSYYSYLVYKQLFDSSNCSVKHLESSLLQ